MTNNPTARRIAQGAIGTQTAAIFVGNNSTISTQTELYDGTNWTEGATINTGRKYLAGFGIQTAATIVGGVAPFGTVTELYDGTSWTTSPATLSSTRYDKGAAGAQLSGFVTGGSNPATNATEEFTESITLKTVTDS